MTRTAAGTSTLREMGREARTMHVVRNAVDAVGRGVYAVATGLACDWLNGEKAGDRR